MALLLSQYNTQSHKTRVEEGGKERTGEEKRESAIRNLRIVFLIVQVSQHLMSKAYFSSQNASLITTEMSRYPSKTNKNEKLNEIADVKCDIVLLLLFDIERPHTQHIFNTFQSFSAVFKI